jgi:hypothetical protein
MVRANQKSTLISNINELRAKKISSSKISYYLYIEFMKTEKLNKQILLLPVT